MLGLFFSELGGTIGKANDAFLKMVGYTRTDLEQGKISWRDMTPPEGRAADELRIKTISDERVVAPFEKQYIRKDGSRLDILIGAAEMQGLDRFPILTYVLDISERKRVEEQLRQANLELDRRVKERTGDLVEANQFLDSVLENIPHAIFVKDAKTLQIVRTNKSGEKMTGMSRHQLIGKTVHELFPKEQADLITRDDHEILAGSSLVERKELFVSVAAKPGIYLHIKRLPLFASNGELRYILSMSEDITERRGLELERISLVREQANRDEAAKSAERIRVLWEATALLSSSLDFQTTLKHLARAVVPALADWSWVIFKSADGSFKRLESATADPRKSDLRLEVMEKFSSVFLPNADDPAAKVLRTGVSEMAIEVEPGALEKIAQNPEQLALLRQLNVKSYICVPLKARGEVVGVLGLAVTADSNRRFTASDLQLMETLAERASIAIENAKLYEEARRANRVKDEFLATLSHELRSPLNVFLGNSVLLSCERVSP
ncbi:MAG: PAS domain S-box protein, partial [Bdellovibrionota bacterium]